jgi:phenylalanyl-tRNA synthetase beta chain
MKISLSWLNELAPFGDDVAALTETLDDLGLLVEGIERSGEGLEAVIVARVDKISAIEGADRVREVSVFDGEGQLTIVCGAMNFSVGDLVPLAPVGAVLPGGFEIAKRKMRGVESNGMLCAAGELGLEDSADGLMVLNSIDGASPGASFSQSLGIIPDVIFDIAVEGNRPDAWSVHGVARDLAARMGLALTLPIAQTQLPAAKVDGASAKIEAADLCGRLCVAKLEGIVVGPSPTWIQRRLSASGMRPINNVVDASNLVMLEMGQPTHPYDLAGVDGGGIVVRRAKAGEVLTTLDGVSRTLGLARPGVGTGEDDLVITAASGSVLGVAGIMGGASSEIAASSTSVLLELAYFDAMAIAKTSKALGLRTEASARFERGCDPRIIEAALCRFVDLVKLSCPSASLSSDLVILEGETSEPAKIEISLAAMNRFLGTQLDAAGVATLLEPRLFSCQVDGDTLSVLAPSSRSDIRPMPFGVADLYEEIARTAGYRAMARSYPSWSEPGGLSIQQQLRRSLREICVGLGCSEVWTPSILPDKLVDLAGIVGPALKIANPLSSDESTLRTGMLAGMLQVAQRNLERQRSDVALFELGTVFVHPANMSEPRLARTAGGSASNTVLPGEQERLSLLFAREGDDAKTAVVAWRTLEASLGLEPLVMTPVIAEELPLGCHPTRCAKLTSASGALLGFLGEIDPALIDASGIALVGERRRIGWLDIHVDLLADVGQIPRRPLEAKPISRFPSAAFDLAFVVPNKVLASTLEAALVQAAADPLESIRLFDVFRGGQLGDDERSLAFELRLSSIEKTLSDADLGEVRAACIAAAESLGASLRN